MLVSTARMASTDFIGDRFVEVFVAHMLALGVQAAEPVFKPGRGEWARRPQENAIPRFLDDKLLARAPALTVADRLRQDDLALRRDRGCRFLRQSHRRSPLAVRRS